MKHVYLHIGLEKTGTKSLQVFLAANESALRAKGYSYLCDDVKPYFQEVGHFPVAACFSSECPDFVLPSKFRPAAEVLGELRRDVGLCDKHVILSCEHFSSRLRDVSALQAIREALPNRSAKVICYLRRQDEFALAAYSTAVLSGRRRPFRVDQVTAKHRYYNFQETLELWGSVFGRESILVREFDRKRFVDGDVRRDFLGLLGIDDAGFCFGGDENVSLDAQQVEALRQINFHLPRFDEGGPEAYALAMTIRRVVIEHLPKGDPLGAMLLKGKRSLIMESFRSSNALLSSMFPGCSFVADWQTVRNAQRSRPIALTSKEFAGTVARLGRRLVESSREVAKLKSELASANNELAMLRGRLNDTTPSPPPGVPATDSLVMNCVRAVKRRLGRGD